MKKTYIFVLIFILSIFIIPLKSFAHPPSSIYLDYDSDLTVLVGQINHKVLDPTDHYVKRIVISINDSAVYDNSFDTQTDRDSMNIPPLNISAKAGDIITVTAYCSKSGSKTVNYTVKDKSIN